MTKDLGSVTLSSNQSARTRDIDAWATLVVKVAELVPTHVDLLSNDIHVSC